MTEGNITKYTQIQIYIYHQTLYHEIKIPKHNTLSIFRIINIFKFV